MPSIKAPVKDCPMLPDLLLVNCTVVDGVPKLKGLPNWDGTCKKYNWYVLGTLSSSHITPKLNTSNSYVCINCDGVISLFII